MVIAPVAAIFAGCGENNPPENPPPEEASIEGEYINYSYFQDNEDREGDEYTLVDELDSTKVWRYNEFSMTITITADSWDGLAHTDDADRGLLSESWIDPTMTWEEYGDFLILKAHFKEDLSDTEYLDMYVVGQIVDTEIIITHYAEATTSVEAKVVVDEFINSGCEKLYQYLDCRGFSD